MILSPAPPLPNSAAGCTLLASRGCPGWPHPALLPGPHPYLEPLTHLTSQPLFRSPGSSRSPSPWACYITDSLHTSGSNSLIFLKMFSCSTCLNLECSTTKSKLPPQKSPISQAEWGTGPYFCSHSTWFIHLLTKPSFSLLLLLFTDFFS